MFIEYITLLNKRTEGILCKHKIGKNLVNLNAILNHIIQIIKFYLQ